MGSAGLADPTRQIHKPQESVSHKQKVPTFPLMGTLCPRTGHAPSPWKGKQQDSREWFSHSLKRIPHSKHGNSVRFQRAGVGSERP